MRLELCSVNGQGFNYHLLTPLLGYVPLNLIGVRRFLITRGERGGFGKVW